MAYIWQNNVTNLCFASSIPKKEQSYGRTDFKLNIVFYIRGFYSGGFRDYSVLELHELSFGRRGLCITVI